VPEKIIKRKKTPLEGEEEPNRFPSIQAPTKDTDGEGTAMQTRSIEDGETIRGNHSETN
jgi:hypothetical protein